ncbi:MAG: hypothetical protein N2643_03440 [Endomicrobia bacterium]|nr:hypothetical protein [Endomicrobiia bacterium]
MLKKSFIFALFILVLSSTLAENLPKQLLDITLGQHYKEITQKYQLKKIKTKDLYKSYEIIYTEDNNIKTTLDFWSLKVFKVTIIYNKDFLDEYDWTNIYNQAILNYGKPTNVKVEKKDNLLEENYIWEDNYIILIYKRTMINEQFTTFNIELTDKTTKIYIEKLTPIKKFYYRLLKIF